MGQVMAQDRQDAAKGDDGPRMVTLPRAGKPPLRLKAQPVDRVLRRSVDGGSLELALWVRPGGGVALQYTRPGQRPRQLDAVTLPGIEEALDEIERLCVSVARRSRPSPPRRRNQAKDVLLALQTAFAEQDDARGFLELASEALERWAQAAPLKDP